MADLTLYHLPGACSRVTLTALEQVGATYADRAVDLKRGEQRSPAYLAVNPRGKIPALLVDGNLLVENAAILWWLHQKHPQAGLLPEGDGWVHAQQMSDLFWVSSVWHPSVRANMMPIRWTTGDPAPVRERGKQLIKPLLERLEARLAQQLWWYGAAWSILDTYLFWCYTTAEEGGYDLSGLPAIADHRRRVAEHPAFIRAIAREDAARERMA
jgi:glutathione S-transferase